MKSITAPQPPIPLGSERVVLQRSLWGKVLLFSIATFSFSILFAQPIPVKPNKTDAKNLRQGEWILLFDDAWKEVSNPSSAFYYRIISYKDDLPQGMATDFYKNGNKQWQGMLLKDRPEVYEGKQTWYYENGNKRIEEIYKNNEPTVPALAFLKDGQPADPLWKVNLYDKAYELSERKDYERAAKLFTECLEHVEAFLAEETEEYADILVWLTLTYHSLSDRENVLRYSIELANVYKSLRPPGDPDYLSSLFDVGRTYKFLGQWEKAEEWLKLYFSEEEKNSSEYHSMHGIGLSALSEVYMETQRYSVALETLQKAVAYYKENPPEDRLETELVNLHLRRANVLAGHWTDGRKLLLDELKTIEKQKGKSSETYLSALTALGNFYKMNGQLREAETCFLNALSGIEKSGSVEDPLLLVSASIPLVEVYYQLGQPQFGEKYVGQTRAALSKFDRNTPGYDLVYVGFLKRAVVFYEMLGNNAETEKLISDWQSFAKMTFGAGSMEFLYAMMAGAEHEMKQKRLDQAEISLLLSEKIVSAFHPSEMSSSDIRLVAKVYEQLGTLNLLRENTSTQTETYLFKSEENYNGLFEKEFVPELIDVLLSRAVLNEMKGNKPEADRGYRKCLDLVRQHFSEDHINYVIILFAIARKSEMRNDLQASSAYYKEALQKLNSYINSVFPYLTAEGKEQFYQSNAEWIMNFQSFAVNHSGSIPTLADQLYDLQLTTKGIVLKSINRVRRRIISSGSDQVKADYKLWLEKKNALVKFYQQASDSSVVELNKRIDEVNSLEKKLSEQSQDFSNFNKQKTVGWKNVQATLKENEAAIEFLYVRREIRDDSIYVALIIRKSSDHPVVVMLSTARELEGKKLRFYRNAILSQLPDTLSYSSYWKPLVKELKGINRVFISSDGIFHQINLSTLYDPAAKRYLADDVEIRYVPSTSALIRPKEGFRPTRHAVIVAHPDYGKSTGSSSNLNRSFDLDNVPDLPGTEDERLALTELMKRNSVQYQEFSSKTATEESLKAVDNPFVLHIATHGFFLNNMSIGGDDNSFFGLNSSTLKKNPLLRSGLLLTNCQDQSWKKSAESSASLEDGILTAFEASTMKLEETQLVVLSACETGLGEIKNGEGVYGLQRAFIMAGARQMIMSLWKVDDEATQEFMVSFYEEWLKTADASGAFMKAQKISKLNHPSPYYWGAFVLNGL